MSAPTHRQEDPVPHGQGDPAAPEQVTQARHPVRATVRTVVAFGIGLAAVWGVIVETAGVDPSLPVVSASVAVAGAVTRVLALPGVESLLRRTPGLSWLAAANDQV